MKKTTTILALLCFTIFQNFAQPCQTGRIEITSQSDVDNFAANYPGCTKIQGSIRIMGAGITNLNGLSQISSISDTLYILYNSDLTSLAGLDNLDSLGGSLTIVGNPLLVDFTGLNSLNSIDKFIWVSNNVKLASFKGLDSLSYLGGNLNIDNNPELISLEGLSSISKIGGGIDLMLNKKLLNLNGLDSLTQIGGGISFTSNDKLSNLAALLNLTKINGVISIWSNNSLVSLTGLDNIVPLFITNLQIMSSSKLVYCNINSICNYLADPNNPASIVQNGSGCGSRSEIITSCSNSPNSCLQNGYTFHTQKEIDDFQLIYPGCKEIIGNVSINGLDIENLNGLSEINKINGLFQIILCPSLITLSGIDSLEYVGGYLWIDKNEKLTDLTALSNVTYVGGDMAITKNNLLSSLSGLENIDAQIVQNLYIQECAVLTTCEVKTICDFIEAKPSKSNINDNAPGCNTRNEIKTACSPVISVEEIQANNFKIYPNPASDNVTITGIADKNVVTIKDLTGRVIVSFENVQKQLNLSAYAKGMYLVQIESENVTVVRRLLIN